MITMPIKTPSPIRPAVSRKSLPPLAAGAPDPLAAADGLATATTDRVGTAVVPTVAVGGAVVGAAGGGGGGPGGASLPPAGGPPFLARVGVGSPSGVCPGGGRVVVVPGRGPARPAPPP